MTFPIFYSGQILFSGGQLATSSGCCCSGVGPTPCEDEDCSAWTLPQTLSVDISDLSVCSWCEDCSGTPDETWTDTITITFQNLFGCDGWYTSGWESGYPNTICWSGKQMQEIAGTTARLTLSYSDQCFWEFTLNCRGSLPYASITVDIWDNVECSGDPIAQSGACVTSGSYLNDWFAGGCVVDYPESGYSAKLVSFDGWYRDSGCTILAPVTPLVGLWRRAYNSGLSNRNITGTYTFVSGDCETNEDIIIS